MDIDLSGGSWWEIRAHVVGQIKRDAYIKWVTIHWRVGISQLSTFFWLLQLSMQMAGIDTNEKFFIYVLFHWLLYTQVWKVRPPQHSYKSEFQTIPQHTPPNAHKCRQICTCFPLWSLFYHFGVDQEANIKAHLYNTPTGIPKPPPPPDLCDFDFHSLCRF